MYATLAAVVDRDVPANTQAAEDSHNVLPAFLGEPSTRPIRQSLILHSPNGNYAIRKGPWKYIEGNPSNDLRRIPRKVELHPQLYNLSEDPGEQHNLLEKNPDVAKSLASLLNDQRERGWTRDDRGNE